MIQFVLSIPVLALLQGALREKSSGTQHSRHPTCLTNEEAEEAQETKEEAEAVAVVVILILTKDTTPITTVHRTNNS